MFYLCSLSCCNSGVMKETRKKRVEIEAVKVTHSVAAGSRKPDPTRPDPDRGPGQVGFLNPWAGPGSEIQNPTRPGGLSGFSDMHWAHYN